MPDIGLPNGATWSVVDLSRQPVVWSEWCLRGQFEGNKRNGCIGLWRASHDGCLAGPNVTNQPDNDDRIERRRIKSKVPTL